MITKVARQPNDSMRKVSSGRAMAVPRVDAQLKMPVASPRSRGLNQSRTTRAPVGNCGASPTPSSSRAVKNWVKLCTSPPSSCASDHSDSPSVSRRRGPSLSTMAPVGSWENA